MVVGPAGVPPELNLDQVRSQWDSLFTSWTSLQKDYNALPLFVEDGNESEFIDDDNETDASWKQSFGMFLFATDWFRLSGGRKLL
jgi:hypothetical protein